MVEQISSAPSTVRIEGDEKVFSDGTRMPLTEYEKIERDLADSGNTSDEYTRAAVQSADIGALQNDETRGRPAGRQDQQPIANDRHQTPPEPTPGTENETTNLTELKQRLTDLERELATLEAEEIAAVPEALTARIAAAEAERDAAMVIAGISKPELIRDIQSASQALKDNPDRERIVRSLGKAAPEYVKTLAATFREFPGSTEKERAVRRAIEQRRYKLFEEGVRKTSEADVKRIGEAIWNFQQKPWHERWGLSGIMAYAGGGTMAGAIMATAFFGCLPVAAAAPLLAAPAAGMGVMKWIHNVSEKRNATGRGRGFIAQHPHIAGLLLGGLAAYGAGGIAANGPGIVGNLFEKVAGGSANALKSLLGVFSVKSSVAISSSALNI